MKLLDIKTFSRYYPSLVFERQDGDAVSVEMLQIVESLKKSFPESKITYYRTYGKICEQQESPQRIINIVVVPHEAQRQNVEKGIAETANFDILAYRIQIVGKHIRLSCWQVSAYTENLDPSFQNETLKQLWDETKDNLVSESEANISIKCSWLDYLRAVDALAGVFSTFRALIPLDPATAEWGKLPLEYILNPDTTTPERLQTLANALQYVVLNTTESYTIVPSTDADYHTHLLTRHPLSVAEYLSHNDQYLASVISADETIALHIANTHLGFRFSENSTLSSSGGDSFSYLYRTLLFSRMENSVIEVELIASLWKSVDNQSMRYTHVRTEWENNTHYSPFFRSGKRLPPILRFITLSLAIHDMWIRQRLENSISDSDLDQLLALATIPESCLNIMEGYVDSDFIDFPDTQFLTLLGGVAGNYYPALNLLLRLKIFEIDKKNTRTYMQVRESELTRFLRNTAYFKTVQTIVNPAFQIYLNHRNDIYSPLVNNVFVYARDRKGSFLNIWQEKAKQYLLGKETEKRDNLTACIWRIYLMTRYLHQQDLVDVKEKTSDEAVSRMYDELMKWPPSDQQLTIEFSATLFFYYWLLYKYVFIDSDNTEAAEVFSYLEIEMTDYGRTESAMYKDLVSIVDKQTLQEGLSENVSKMLKTHIINVLTTHMLP